MSEPLDLTKSFGATAKGLARNPLGIIALFIVLVYGFAALVTAFAGSFQPGDRLPLVWFLVLFPVLVLVVFAWLVSQHSWKLFAPCDFDNVENYLRMQEMHWMKVTSTVNALAKKVDKMDAADRAAPNVNLGESCIAYNRLKDAEVFFARALELDPGNEGALIGHAKWLRRQDKVKEAIAVLDGVIKQNAQSDRAFYNRACYKCLLRVSEQAGAAEAEGDAKPPWERPENKKCKRAVMDDLRRSMELLALNKGYARADRDLESLWADPEFCELTKA